MRLAVNGWRLDGPRTGVGRYLHNVISRWTPDVVEDRFDAVNVYVPRPLEQAGMALPDGIVEHVLRPATRMLAWENTRFGPTATEDVLFCPSYTRPLWVRGRPVVVIHDATSQLYPHLFGRSQPFYNRLYGWSGRHAAQVITSTEAARNDISQLWGVDYACFRVIPLAADEAFRPLAPHTATSLSEQVLGFADPYFMFVGKTTGRRRASLLVEAFAAFKEATGAPHRLVLVGPTPDDFDSLIAGAGRAAPSIIHVGFVPDETLNALYGAAAAFVWPSVYETVSLPIFEAQAAGAAIACVDTPGSRETTGGAALFMPELTIDHLVDAFTRLARDEPLRRELRDAGLANADRFTWDRTARETLDVLADVAARA